MGGVTNYLSRGVDVNTVSEDGRLFGLTIAAEENYLELLEILLSNPDIKINNTTPISNYGAQWTALMIACEAGNQAIVLRLVQEEGLDINYQDERSYTAAHLVSMKGHTKCVRILAETGRVDWNKRDEWGRTPLYLALWLGRSDTVDIIVQQPNIDYNVKDKYGDTLGHAAVEGGNVKCVETLAAQESFDSWNVPDWQGDTPFLSAVKQGKTKIVKFLASCPKVDCNVPDNNGDTAIRIALTQRGKSKTEIVKILLSCPRVDLSLESVGERSLDILRKKKYTKRQDLLWTVISVQPRMILEDSLATRQAGNPSTLANLSRDAVLLILSTKNIQERLVTPLVDRLEGEITPQAREILLAPYSERRS